MEFLNEYAKLFKFEIPIEAEILVKQVHPYHGHLFKGKSNVKFSSLVKLFEVLLVASFEKVNG